MFELHQLTWLAQIHVNIGGLLPVHISTLKSALELFRIRMSTILVRCLQRLRRSSGSQRLLNPLHSQGGALLVVTS